MSDQRPHVVVIGGGLAGLAAAIRCVDAGARVVLLESRKRLGGATWSNHHRGLGFEVDNGQHVFMRCCEQYLAFLERIGVRDSVVLQDRLRVPIVRPIGRTAWIRGARLPAPAHLAPSLLRFPSLSISERIRAGITAARIARLDPEDPGLDDLYLGDWLMRQGESARSIDLFWDLLIRPTLNVPARHASLALATHVIQTGFLNAADAADIGWSRVPFEDLHARPARRILECKGARVLTGLAVDAIESGGAKRKIVHARGRRFEADAVILAVPHADARRLLPEGPDLDRERLRQLRDSPILNIHAVFDRKITTHEIVAGLETDLQWTFDRTESVGLEEGQYLTVSLSSADRWLGRTTRELREVFDREFKKVFPRARQARMDRFAVTIERRATFRAQPGTRRIRPAAGSEISGVHLAGAWTHTGWPATMEGAVRSGQRAADAVLEKTMPRSRTRSEEAA